MVIGGVLGLALLLMLVGAPPGAPSGASPHQVLYRENGCDHGWYPVNRWQCCPIGTVARDGGCYDEEKARTAAFIALIIFCAALWALFDRSGSDDDESEEDVPGLIHEVDDIDPAQLLADLEARAPENLSELEKVEWAAREGQRILSEAARRRR